MKQEKMKKIAQKIIASVALIVVISMTVPRSVYAATEEEEDEWFGKLLRPLVQLVAMIGDIGIGVLNRYMLGTSEMFGSVMLDLDDPNVDEGALKVEGNESSEKTVSLDSGSADVPKVKGFMWESVRLPNMLYSPEAIFSNRIAGLDINFVKGNTYNSVQDTDDAKEAAVSIASKLRPTISSWYKAFRNIAIVGLLSVLIYIGIRILIGATADDKAKYKQRLVDWIVALCLVFIMQYVMSGTLMFTDKVTQLLVDAQATDIVVKIKGQDVKGTTVATTGFKTNLMGYIRFMVQSNTLGDTAAYTIMYLALVIFTFMFTITYLKRVLYMAFFTMISPLVALTYPIDRLGDGKAQAFNMWFREYMMNALIQPVHLILYTVLVSSAAELATDNPIYAIVAIGFLLPAEKFIKKMFRLDKAETPGGLGAVAGGAVAWNAMQNVLSHGRGKSGAGSGNGSNDSSDSASLKRGKTPFSAFKEEPMQHLSGLMEGNQGDPKTAQQARMDAVEAKAKAGNAETPEGRKLARDEATAARMEAVRRAQEELAQKNRAKQEAQGMKPQLGQHQNAKGYEGQGDNNKKSGATKQEANVGFKKPPLRERLRNGGNAVMGRGKKSIARAVSPANIKKQALKAGKFTLKQATKVPGLVAGAALVGTAAAGAALATGDPSKIASIATGGAILGATKGMGFTGVVGDKVIDSTSGALSSLKDTYQLGAYGAENLEIRKQEKYDKEWKNNKDNYEYLMKKQGMTQEQADKFMESDIVTKGLQAGITDVNTLYNASQLKDENNHPYSTEKAIVMAQIAKGVSDDFESNTMQQNALTQQFRTENPNVTTDQVKKFKNDIIKIKKKP